MHRHLAKGLTLIELLTVVAITAILAATAAPSFIQTFARVRLEGAMNALSTDLQYTRSESIRRRTTAKLTVLAGGASYRVSYLDVATNQDVELKTVTMPSDSTLAASDAVQFDALRGTALAQTLTGTSTVLGATTQLRAQTNALGRVQMCSPSGSFKGYPTC